MKDSSKYTQFLNELVSLEKQIYTYVQNSNELILEKKEIEKELEELKKENEVLKLKNEELVEKLNSASADFIENLNEEDRAKLKTKLDSLINKIDYHIRS